jgi:hypothetical protein
MNIIHWFSKKEYISFENIGEGGSYMINTLSSSYQDCLIEGSIDYHREEDTINNWIEKGELNTKIIIYGKNCMDETAEKKYEQLKKYGFRNIYIYKGGLFEWLLLQDIFGVDNFKTSSRCNDILKYKPLKITPF